ncbi:hypothetical protein RQP46_010390 [Phenoliferia psychrophenolica]
MTDITELIHMLKNDPVVSECAAPQTFEEITSQVSERSSGLVIALLSTLRYYVLIGAQMHRNGTDGLQQLKNYEPTEDEVEMVDERIKKWEDGLQALHIAMEGTQKLLKSELSEFSAVKENLNITFCASDVPLPRSCRVSLSQQQLIVDRFLPLRRTRSQDSPRLLLQVKSIAHQSRLLKIVEEASCSHAIGWIDQ